MKYFLVILSIISLVACNQTNTQPGENFDLTGYESEKLSGSSMTYVYKQGPDGNMVEEGYLENGLKHGQWITYDPQKGVLTAIESYLNGKLNGYSFVVSNKGFIEEQKGFKNDVLNGSFNKYRYGKFQFQAQYKDGQLDGIKREYYDNGKIQQETEFKDGVQHGAYKYYNEEGQLVLEYTYKDGVKVSGGMVEPQN
jgi:antitoxin component YwqK of YwqJK toxin-antitoxin module